MNKYNPMNSIKVMKLQVPDDLMSDSRFPTLWQAFDKVGDILLVNKALSSEYSNFLHTGGIGYGETQKFNFGLERFNGRFTSKSLHVQIYRDDNGYYELNTYFN